MVEQGEQAPDFDVPDQHGNPVRLSDFGARMSSSLYPEADAPAR